ncbi:SDR family NAD(P)-dependent oxidoreductase [Streptomyces sp. ATE26]|uniref:SDR family NAD(P)-dependent oxidoreductase n=1 Tax=unclassified Streptomyces TaxID=2593676 RepID=UPI00116F1038|nr:MULTISPECIES: SDR family NAD(P)-dependent oxidoreductase [unclassified Streptomyces]MDI1459208.1 SDR family NAD(P)-dependent oxidoreductase [Streptomyces sp. ATE26]GEK01628.1 short-chain dehydrogenase [Streptomyces sp. 1-11]
MADDGPARRAVVTGASSGIGTEYAAALAARGWDLVLVARRADRLDALAGRLREESGAAVEPMAADLAHSPDLSRVAARVAADDVALLVNNAGINGYGPFAEVDAALLAKVIDVNVVAPTVLTRAALPHMLARGRGAVVNVASLLAFAGALPPDPLPHRAVYGGTKGYMVTFTRTLAAELAGTPVRVQVVCPGLTATEFHLGTGEAPVEGEARVHDEGGMPAADVVEASLAALESDEVVCVPGLSDASAVTLLADAERALRAGSGATLAPRYRDAGRAARC